MPPLIGGHRPGAAAPDRRPGLAPDRPSAHQVARPYDQGELLQTTTRAFQARWGLGVCRVLVAQWLRAGGELEETPFHRAQTLEKALIAKKRPLAAAAVGLDLERMLDQMMDNDRDAMLATNGLQVVERLPLTRRRGDLVHFISQGGLFYVKLASSDEVYGHAIGLVVGNGAMRLFDPNTRVVIADGRTLIRHLWSILDHWVNTPPYLVQYEAVKVVGEVPSLSAAAAAAAHATSSAPQP